MDLGNGVRLLVVPERKFKTVLLRVILRSDLDDGVTARSLAGPVLMRGTRSLPDLMALNRRLDDMYGAALSPDVSKVGDWHVCAFTMSVADERHLPERAGLLAQAAGLLREVLRDPVLDSGRLKASYVAREKESLGRLLASLKDSKPRYAALRLVEIMFAGEPYGRNEIGREEDLARIDARHLTEFWRAWVDAAPMDVLVGGNVDAHMAADLLAPLAAGRSGRGVAAAPGPLAPPGGVREVVETMAIAQGRLMMGYRHGAVVGDPHAAAVDVATGLLGGFPHSKLFTRVREKESLAYAIGAHYDAAKGVVFVSAGIPPDAGPRVRALVEEEVDALCRGDFSDDDLRATKACIVRRLKTVSDAMGATLAHAYLWSLFGGVFSAAEAAAAVEAVTREATAAAAAALRLDTVYFLGGEGGAA